MSVRQPSPLHWYLMPSLQSNAPEITAPKLPLVNTVQDTGFGSVPLATGLGVRGTVSPAGFGTGSGSNRAVGGKVQGTDFGRDRLAATTSVVHSRSIATEPVITYEPKPEYTKEASVSTLKEWSSYWLLLALIAGSIYSVLLVHLVWASIRLVWRLHRSYDSIRNRGWSGSRLRHPRPIHVPTRTVTNIIPQGECDTHML